MKNKEKHVFIKKELPNQDLILSFDFELEELKRKINILMDRLTEEELSLISLEIELSAFEKIYISELGHLIAELDLLDAKILELLSTLYPSRDNLRNKASKAHQKAKISGEEVKKEPENYKSDKKFLPSESLKSLYREVAKRIHPDFSINDEDCELRTLMMIEANKAFENIDENKLKELLIDSETFNKTSMIEKLEIEIDRLKRKIIQIEHQIKILIEKQMVIKSSDLYSLKLKVANANDNGINLLKKMGEHLKNQIEDKKKIYRDLLKKFTDEDRSYHL
ncbi:MAG: hypothetical protein CL609_24130 [Anaerolineaceae bacterium]|nr:hypothetical protein [Anaerolineaceae bacterium]